MKIYVVGIGLGNPKLLTEQARETVAGCGLLIGARRMLDAFPESTAEKCVAVEAAKIAELLYSHRQVERSAVLVSGDVGFYSMAKGLGHPLENEDVEYLPGISSLQYFCAKLGLSWDDAKLLSLHGRDGDLSGTAAANAKTFALTGGDHTPQALCGALCAAGLGRLRVYVGENLSYSEERVSSGTAEELAGQTFAPLSVMMVLNPKPLLPPATHGLPDDAFLRGDVPMTKEEVRAASVAKLHLQRGQILWDVGAGTGSISVEAARVLGGGTVYAVEHSKEALALLEQNKLRFSLHNLRVIPGSAPGALESLPAPDAVFIGGSSGNLSRIVELALEKNPRARLVINAITLETVGAALGCFNRLALPQQEIVQLAVSRAKTVGGNRMMLGQNPVYILSAGGGKAADGSY